MDSDRKTALAAGLLFIATFVTAIVARVLYAPVFDDGYVLGGGADSAVALGAVFELLLIVANVGTAVILFPILKRQSESGALGYVAARIMECSFIAVGILALLAVVTLRQDAGGDAANLTVVGESLVAVHEWTFLLGPGFVVGLGNGLLLGYLMYRSGLVPRRMAMLGLVGGPLVCASGVAVALGAIEPGSTVQAVATIPEIAWEASLGIYLIVKGFRPAPILREQDGRPGPASQPVVSPPSTVRTVPVT